MDLLNKGYKEAVDKAKKDILNDIYLFMEESETKPSLNDYIESRQSILNQIWNLAWKSKTLQRMNKYEKHTFLEQRGIVTDGASKKTINKMVEQELTGLKTFDMKSWLHDYFGESNQLWDELFETVKLKRLKSHFEDTILKDAASEILIHNKLYFYLKLRFKIAEYLREDIAKVKDFNRNNYVTLTDLLYWGYEDNHHDQVFDEYIYQNLMSSFIYEFIYPFIVKDLPPELKSQYEKLYRGEVDFKLIKRLIGSKINEFQWEYESEMEREHIEDLLEVCDYPDQFDTQMPLYHSQHKRRVEKREQQLEETRKQEEERQKKLEDIFGVEYKTTVYSNTKYVLHIGETNTGKTFQALKRLKQAQTGIYLAPLRLLALEVYETLRKSGIQCALKTGEEEKNIKNATHYSCTIEMFTEKDRYDVIVIDEAQMIADQNRGFSWFRAINNARAQEVHIIGSQSSKSMIINLLQ